MSKNEFVATVVSIVPFELNEEKPGVYPGNFYIPAAIGGPEVLVVGQSVYHIEVDENRSVTVPCPANEIARSIVEDYVNSNLAYSEKENAAPGLFWEIGRYTKIEVITKLGTQLERAKLRQINWFNKLVEMADDDWEKTRQHKTISDMQRFACKSLGLSRPWVIVPVKPGSNKECIACRSVVHPEAIVCPQCRAILNIEAWKKMQFAEVK